MMISVNQFNLHDCSPTLHALLPTKEGHKETQEDDVTVWRHLPRHAQQVVQQLLVLLRLGSLPPRVLVEGEEGGSAPVPPPGQGDQLLLHRDDPKVGVLPMHQWFISGVDIEGRAKSNITDLGRPKRKVCRRFEW